MKKRFFTAAAALIIALLSAVPVAADLAIDYPYGTNDFEKYMTDYSLIDYCQCEYYADGADGGVAVVDNPDRKNVLATVDNGFILFVFMTYPDKNGEPWGVVELVRDEKGEIKSGTAPFIYNETPSVYTTGWVKMSDMYAVYDFVLFEREHSGEYGDFDGDYTPYVNTTLSIYSFPCSGQFIYSVDYPTRGDMTVRIENFYKTWVDYAGRTWVQYRWNRSWFCMDDPSNPDIPFSDTIYKNYVPKYGPESDAAVTVAPDTPDGLTVYAVITVASAALLVAAIAVFAVKNRKKSV